MYIYRVNHDPLEEVIKGKSTGRKVRLKATSYTD